MIITIKGNYELKKKEGELIICVDEAAEDTVTIEKKAVHEKETILEMQQQMCDTTNGMKAELIRYMDGFQKEFCNVLGKWQSSIYPQEYLPVAERYIELYSMLNEHKVFDEVPEEKMKKQAEENKKRMSIFLDCFEKALKGLGLYVFVPEAGEAFDEVKEETEEEDLENRAVRKCILPGIAKKNIMGEEDVLLRSVVELLQKDVKNDTIESRNEGRLQA